MKGKKAMKRVVFRFIEGMEPNHMNIPGDCIDMRDGFIFVWDGENVVAIVRQDIVNYVCISERKD